MDFILSAHDVLVPNITTYKKIDILRGRVTFICGESGCGKSTLLKLFNATISPSQGTLLYNNQLISETDTVTLRKEVILVSQSVFLFDGTINENFNQYYAYRDMAPLPAPTIRHFLSLCCADFDLSSICEKMSGGERQRIFTAICLSLMPKVLMLDEPTSALDEMTANRLLHSIKEFCVNNEITLIIVSHDQTLASQFADEKIFLKKEALL